MTAEAKAVTRLRQRDEGKIRAGGSRRDTVGSEQGTAERTGDDTLQSYGSLKDLGEKEIKSLIHQMIVEGYLYQTDDQYSVLKIGNKTLAELENATILVKMYEEKEPSRRQQRGSRRRNTDMLTGEGFELF